MFGVTEISSVNEIKLDAKFVGTVVTVANLGDSRVVLGYAKEIYPEVTESEPSSGLDSAGTTPEEARTVSTKGKSVSDGHRRLSWSVGCIEHRRFARPMPHLTRIRRAAASAF